MRCALTYRMPLAQLVVRIGPVTLKQKENYYHKHQELWPEAKPKETIVSALIDTGASVTIIDTSIVDLLELPAHGYCPVSGFDSRTENGDAPKKYPNYEVGLGIFDSDKGSSLLTIGTGQAVVPFSSIDRSAEKLSAARRQKEAKEQAARRRAYFRKLECEAQVMWDKVPELIERKQTKAYDQAAEILYALKCLAIEKDKLCAFHQRAATLINNYPTLRGMRSRMEAAGVLPDDGSPRLVKKAIEQKRWQESHSPELSFDFSLLRA